MDAYFTLLDYIFYLATIIVGYTVFSQWQWARTCRNNILIVIKLSQGGTKTLLCKKEGNSVQLKIGDAEKTFVMTTANTVPMLYPGTGLVPSFLQKEIQMTILDEGDLEPALNFTEGKEPIASPTLLNNLIMEKVTAFLINFTQEVEQKLKALSNMLNPNHFYIASGVIIISIGWIVLQIVKLQDNIAIIKIGLGL